MLRSDPLFIGIDVGSVSVNTVVLSSREPTFGNSEGIAGWPIEGQSLDIDESGALLVRLDSGVVTRILSGRVEVIR